ASTHAAIEYTLTFSDGPRINQSTAVKLGYALPDAPTPPSRPGWTFNGWYTELNGGGTKYYNADCSVALGIDEYANVGDLTLYGAWTLTDPSAACTISINGVGLVGGVSQTGDGWTDDPGVASYSTSKRGGYAGGGGSAGANGSHGTVYKAAGATVSGTCASLQSASTHAAIEYTLTFSDGPRINQSTAVKLGYALPDAPTPPERSGWTFNGWYTELNDGGTKYYNADCSLALGINEYANVGNLMLYGAWTLTDPSAACTISINGVGLVGGVSQTGDGWTYDGSTGYVQLSTEGKRYVVTGNDSVGEFSLYTRNTCTVVMSNLVINASANENRPPFETKEGTGCTLLFEGGNTLYGARNCPAIYVCPNSSLTIGECDGTLTATGGYNAPAIGGKTENTSTTGVLNIRGGTIVATGGEYAAGIGGGKGGSFGTIAISGGEVTATGGEYGAGLGGGNFGSFTGVEISGGSVTATGGNRAAGIGGGREGDGGNIKISGGAVTAKAVNYAAGIGAGDSPNSGSSSAISVDITGGIVTASSQKASGIGAADYVTCGAVRISGGTIHARTANDSACAIGSSANSAASSVTITGGAVYSDKDDISPAAANAAAKAVFPVDLAIGETSAKVTSLTLYGALTGYSYGTNDMWTDASGNLRVWLPATDGKGFVAKVTMESGNEYMFSFTIDDDGTPTVAGFLAVNGDIVASDADHSGTAWSFVKSTGVLTLTAD
ncbi:MAG: InlB B-repeat-containing protein, partial [Kiritimatiellae bacterium]|nr:InlB B-repeat-containing protein [Kiritimatiellia bacterium]